jgi:hypothetical protein
MFISTPTVSLRTTFLQRSLPLDLGRVALSVLQSQLLSVPHA